MFLDLLEIRDGWGGGSGAGPRRYQFYFLPDITCYGQTKVGKVIFGCLRDFDSEISSYVHVYVPHIGSENSFKLQIMAKQWPSAALETLNNSPCIALLQEEIITFDPLQHSYVLLRVDSFFNKNGLFNEHMFRKTLGTIVGKIKTGNDIFTSMKNAGYAKDAHKLLDVIELKPSFFGVSLDLKKLFQVLR